VTKLRANDTGSSDHSSVWVSNPTARYEDMGVS
jgi:hypothetical protein